MIRYCTCYIEYLFRIDVTDSRDRIGESLSSALLPVSLPDAKIHLYTLVNSSDINPVLLRDGEKKTEETAVITKELLSQGKNCSNCLSRNGWIHLPPTVCDSLKCFHSTRHKIMSMNNPRSVRRSSLCCLFQLLCVAHGSDTAFVYPGLSKSFPSANVTTGQCIIVFHDTSSWYTGYIESTANPIHRGQSSICKWVEVLQLWLWRFLVADIGFVAVPA